MQAAAEKVVPAKQWGAAISGGGVVEDGLTWAKALPRRWWRAWLLTPRRLGADPSTFVNLR